MKKNIDFPERLISPMSKKRSQLLREEPKDVTKRIYNEFWLWIDDLLSSAESAYNTFLRERRLVTFIIMCMKLEAIESVIYISKSYRDIHNKLNEEFSDKLIKYRRLKNEIFEDIRKGNCKL